MSQLIVDAISGDRAQSWLPNDRKLPTDETSAIDARAADSRSAPAIVPMSDRQNHEI